MDKDTKVKITLDSDTKKTNIKISRGLGRVAQLVKVLSQYTKFLDSIFGQGTYKTQSINA